MSANDGSSRRRRVRWSPVGNSSRSTHVAAKLALGRNVTTEVVNNEMNDATSSAELKSSPANFYSYPGQSREIAPVVVL